MITPEVEPNMKNFYVYLADIYGDNIDIEKGILQDIAEVKQGKRETDEEKERYRLGQPRSQNKIPGKV